MSDNEFFSDAWKIMIEEDSIGEEIAADEMTAEMYSKLINKSQRAASRILFERYKSGELTRRKVILNDFGQGYAYKIAKKDDKDGPEL